MIRPSKRSLPGVCTVVIIVCAVWYTWSSVHTPEAPPNTRVFLDELSGERFEVELTEDLGPFPLVNPKTGQPTLWPAEFCMSPTCSNRGGTPVILNTYLGKVGPTRCPVCQAEVRLHNASRTKAAKP